MADLTGKQKKEWAAMLYLKENLTQQEIADKVGTTRVTVNKWAKDEKWAERKAGFTITREEQIKNLYRQIAEINDVIVNRDKGERFASPTEADTLSKLSSAIKKMETETGIAEIVSVGTRFLEFLRTIDLDKAKEFTQFFDIFIKQNL
jgi:transcriptional regulator with XRE-family HTH domain